MLFNELNKNDWEQIANYLSGEMNQSEIEVFQKRIDFSDENKEYFNQVKKDWENMENLRKEEDTFDSDKAWGKLFNKFEEDGLVESKKTARVISLKRIMQIAAIFIFGAVFSSLVYYMMDTKKTNNMLADSYNLKGIKEVTLSDGSIVYLNADSKLYYPANFEGNTRTVEFEGDAFFDIAKNPDKPFIIKAKNAEIKVLGTSFNVNTNIGGNEVEVLVETGKVQLSSNNETDYIEPGFMGKTDKGKITKKQNSDVNYMAWKTKSFNFENGIKLQTAIEVLNRSYHANIQFSDKSIADTELYTSFNNKPLDTILNILCETYYLKFIKKENSILLMPQ